MKFGIFYELQLPKPWGPNDELNLYQNALDQVELADKLGYDYAWEVEHHFLDEYSHSPQPEVFLAAASQRTKHIRLGHGIIQLTTNHPARVAEKIACLDLVSKGRVEFGMGESGSVHGTGAVRHRHGEEAARSGRTRVRCIIPMMSKEGWQYDGPYFKFPLRNVTPKPIQQPHPPLWVACSQLETIEMAGRRGIGALGFQFLTSEMAHAWVHAYYNAFTKRQEKLCEYNSQRQHRDGVVLHVRGDRRGSAPTGGRHHLLPVRARLLLRLAQSRTRRARHRQHVGRVQQVEDRPIRKRTRRRCAAA